MCRRLRINLYCANHNPRICFGLPAEALDEDDRTYLRNRLTYSREGIIPCTDEAPCRCSTLKGEAIQVVGGWGTCRDYRRANAHALLDADSQFHMSFLRRFRNDKVNKACDEVESHERAGFEDLLDIPAGFKLPMWAYYRCQRKLRNDGQTLHLDALKDKLYASVAEYYIYDNGTVSYSGEVDEPAFYEVLGRRGRFYMF